VLYAGPVERAASRSATDRAADLTTGRVIAFSRYVPHAPITAHARPGVKCLTPARPAGEEYRLLPVDELLHAFCELRVQLRHPLVQRRRRLAGAAQLGEAEYARAATRNSAAALVDWCTVER